MTYVINTRTEENGVYKYTYTIGKNGVYCINTRNVNTRRKELTKECGCKQHTKVNTLYLVLKKTVYLFVYIGLVVGRLISRRCILLEGKEHYNNCCIKFK